MAGFLVLVSKIFWGLILLNNGFTLKAHFMLKDFEYAKYFLAYKQSRTSNRIYISQRKYCIQIVDDVGFLTTKPTQLIIPNFLPLLHLMKSLPTLYQRRLNVSLYLIFFTFKIQLNINLIKEVMSNIRDPLKTPFMHSVALFLIHQYRYPLSCD